VSRGGGNPRWAAVVARAFYLRIFSEFGALYGGVEDECEALAIRDECEAMGVPMGYGRVQRTPIQLNDYEARWQFRAGRNWK